MTFARRHKNVARGICALASVAVLFIFYFKFGPHQSELYKGSDRWEWWMAALRMAYHHPWTGIGLGAYGTAFPFFKHHPGQNSIYAHSFPIELLGETGIPGFLCLTAFFCRFLAHYVRSAKDHEHPPYEDYERAAAAMRTITPLMFQQHYTLHGLFF